VSGGDGKTLIVTCWSVKNTNTVLPSYRTTLEQQSGHPIAVDEIASVYDLVTGYANAQVHDQEHFVELDGDFDLRAFRVYNELDPVDVTVHGYWLTGSSGFVSYTGD
jgi:hypothetical protein